MKKVLILTVCGLLLVGCSKHAKIETQASTENEEATQSGEVTPTTIYVEDDETEEIVQHTLPSTEAIETTEYVETTVDPAVIEYRQAVNESIDALVDEVVASVEAAEESEAESLEALKEFGSALPEESLDSATADRLRTAKWGYVDTSSFESYPTELGCTYRKVNEPSMYSYTVNMDNPVMLGDVISIIPGLEISFIKSNVSGMADKVIITLQIVNNTDSPYSCGYFSKEIMETDDSGHAINYAGVIQPRSSSMTDHYFSYSGMKQFVDVGTLSLYYYDTVYQMAIPLKISVNPQGGELY